MSETVRYNPHHDFDHTGEVRITKIWTTKIEFNFILKNCGESGR